MNVRTLCYLLVFSLQLIAQEKDTSKCKKPCEWTDANQLAPQSIAIEDSLFGSSMFPTLLGLEYSSEGKSYLSFSIFQGLALYKKNFGENKSNVLLLKLAYHGGYDFFMDLGWKSSPILSRVQNPMAYFDVRLYYDKKYRIPIYFGWAHESNGMYLETQAEADSFKKIRVDYDPKAFASMGWDYYFLRFGTVYVNKLLNECPQYTKEAIMIEYRYHVQQMSGFDRNGIEDVSLFGIARPTYGIRSVDGLRLSYGYHWQYDKHSSLSFAAEVLTGEFNADFGKYLTYTASVFAKVPCGGVYLPLFISTRYGYRFRLSEYSVPYFSSNVGFSLSTESLFQTE